VGLFEAVRGGTVFLDEIGDMPLGLQAKILHVLQSNEVKPLGATEFRRVDMRIIAATNKTLSAGVESGHFRGDLYFRLNVLPLVMPPLRDRPEDIPLLLAQFLQRFAQASGRPPMTFASDAMERLVEYHWPGNIREMENLVKYLLTVTLDDTIQLSDLPKLFAPAPHEAQDGRTDRAPLLHPEQKGQREPLSLSGYSWEGLERDYIRSLLDDVKWNIAAAARQAGIKRTTFSARMKKLGISKR
jgi:transcriptional regulator with GAF, ATPase, and Fis domain